MAYLPGERGPGSRRFGASADAADLFQGFWRAGVFYIQKVQIRGSKMNQTRVACFTNQEIGPPQEPITSFIHSLKSGYMTLTVLREKHPFGTRASAAHAGALLARQT